MLPYHVCGSARLGSARLGLQGRARTSTERSEGVAARAIAFFFQMNCSSQPVIVIHAYDVNPPSSPWYEPVYLWGHHRTAVGTGLSGNGPKWERPKWERPKWERA